MADQFHLAPLCRECGGPVSTLQGYLSCIQEITSRAREAVREEARRNKGAVSPGELNLWFRGLSKSSYECEPQLFREDEVVREAYGVIGPNGVDHAKLQAVEQYLLSRFKVSARQHVSLPDSAMAEWLSVLQHYKIPTRLLDWSKNALVALYFAVHKDDGKHAARLSRSVWVLDPRALCQEATGSRYIPDSSEQTKRPYDRWFNHEHWENPTVVESLPLPIIPIQQNVRFTAQASRFTVHTQRGSFTGDGPGTKHLVQIALEFRDTEELAQMKSDLRTCEIMSSTIAPSLDSIGEAIQRRFSRVAGDLANLR